MVELENIKALLDKGELVPSEEIEKLYWALRGTVDHIQDTQQYGYRTDGDYVLWLIKRNLGGNDDETND